MLLAHTCDIKCLWTTSINCSFEGLGLASTCSTSTEKGEELKLDILSIYCRYIVTASGNYFEQMITNSNNLQG